MKQISRNLLKSKELKTTLSEHSFKGDITSFFKNRDLKNSKLFQINNNLTASNNNISTYDDFVNKAINKNFIPLILSNKMKNFNPLDMQDLIDIYNYTHFLENEEKAIIFVGDLENHKHSFCSGANLKYFYTLKNNIENYYLYNNLAYLTVYKLYEFKLKNEFNNIFIWNGIVMGGGLAPGIYSKFRIATESTLLAMPETKFGFYPNITFPYFISNFLTKEEAYFFGLLSHRLNGLEAYVFGFATNFVLDKHIRNLITEITKINKKNEEEILEIIKKYERISFEEINKSHNYNSLNNENNLYHKFKSKLFVENFCEKFNFDNLKKNKEIYFQEKHFNDNLECLLSSDFRRFYEQDLFNFDKNDYLENFANYQKRNLLMLEKDYLKYEKIDFDYLENYNSNKNKEPNILLDTIYNSYIYNKICRRFFLDKSSTQFNKNNIFKDQDHLIFQRFYENLIQNLEEEKSQKKNSFIRNLSILVLNELNIRSLLSLRQTHELIEKAYKNLNFDDYYDLDLDKSMEAYNNGEAFEGIRAYFLEKDNQPKWKFKTFNDFDKLV